MMRFKAIACAITAASLWGCTCSGATVEPADTGTDSTSQLDAGFDARDAAEASYDASTFDAIDAAEEDAADAMVDSSVDAGFDAHVELNRCIDTTQGWCLHAFLKSDPVVRWSMMGMSIAANAAGDLLVAGAPEDDFETVDTNGNPIGFSPRSGAVHTFNRVGDDWTYNGILKVGPGHSEAQFGTSVSMSADGASLVVGAPWGACTPKDPSRPHEDRLGAVRTYRRESDGWTFQSCITQSDAAQANRGFGHAVDLGRSGNTLSVASYYSASGFYIFQRESAEASWSEQRSFPFSVLEISTTSDEDFVYSAAFGTGVRQHDRATQWQANELLVVPANPNGVLSPTAILGGLVVGDVLADRYSGRVLWVSTSEDAVRQTLFPDPTGYPDLFGERIATSLNGYVVIVSATGDESAIGGINPPRNGMTVRSGAAYVFRRQGDGYVREALLKHPRPRPFDMFSRDIALSDDGTWAFVSAYGDSRGDVDLSIESTNFGRSGAVAVYRYFGPE